MNGNRALTIAAVIVAGIAVSPIVLLVLVAVSVLGSSPAMACTVTALPSAAPGASGSPAPAPTPAPGPAPVTEVGNWNAEQVGHAATIVTVGAEMNVPKYGWVVAVATAMQESSLRNLGDLGDANDHDSLGLFQQRPSMGWGTPAQLTDPRYAARKFYERLVEVDGWQELPLTVAAQRVQRSATPDAYAKWQTEAEQIVDAVTGTLGITCTSDGGDGLPGSGTGGIPPGYRLPSDQQQAAAVRFALEQVGEPYVFGAEGPDTWDCSGLMQKAWAAAGVSIPRVTGDQVRTGVAVGSLAALEPGDLILIPGSDGTMSRPGHVGMYIGLGGDGKQYLVHAPRTGDVVKVVPVSGWSSKVAAIRRPVAK
ncbi:lipoprotein [Actinoplanes sp. OR16]|uniref:NlpC/P60 family protein n=1 Tax=Actinoplanes sp. OR16 TaxID=946334 RepID=UPI000F6B82AC|nr:NlpC/P60 family protein [Actinoplanes sp. OR16]BBH67103.1 lipoprotein [Actinoplanes sp. OR16]